MASQKHRRLWLFAIVFLLGTHMTTAQESPLSLRELAARNDIQIGAAVYTTHLNDPAHAETLRREFNVLTPENEAKFCELQAQPGQFDFRRLDQLVAFADQHNMEVHGHTLVWHQCLPSWVTNGQYNRDQAIGLLRDHIYTVVGRYQGRIPIWDVVNEGVDDRGAGLRDTPWHAMIGDDYIELAFRFAHKADPSALLFYNDYGAEAMNAKSDAIYAMLSDFVERGVPIHGVGLQAHFTLNTINSASIARNIQRLGELGLQVQITEMDVRYEGDSTADILSQQAGDYRAMLQVCLDSDYCTAFIVWGVTDKFSWLRGENLGFFNNPTVEPLLFDDHYQPKPAYDALLDLLGQPGA
jgi:endo-1,4-beta-xylanase